MYAKRLFLCAKLVYLAFMAAMALMSYRGLSFISPTPYNLIYGLLGAAALLIMVLLYRTAEAHNDLLLLLPVITLITLSDLTLLLVNSAVAIAILLWLLTAGKKPMMRGFHLVSHSILLLVCVLSLGAHILFDGFSLDTVLSEARSPDSRYLLRVIDHDEGALGGDTLVELQRVYFGLARRVRILYSGEWGQRPQVKWLDHEHVRIDGRVLDIHRSPSIENYRWR